jgi:RNA polymerase sigma-70 factor (ECF subfamily)
MRKDRRVVAGSGADMHGVLARLRVRARDQHCVKRRPAVVQAALPYDADQQILVEIDRVVVRRRHIAAQVQDRPWPRPEERLAAHRGERRLDARMGRVKRHHDLLGIGAPDDRQFLLFHSVEEPGRVRCDLLRGWRHDALLYRAVRAARRDADATEILNFFVHRCPRPYSPGAWHPGGAMADASQQVKEWGRHPVPLQRDVGAALASLSEEDLVRLRAIARLRARSLPGDMSWSDLLHEAVLRALTGARPWPPSVPLLAFLAGVMRSICDEQWRRHRRQDHLPTPHDTVRADDPERTCAAAEALASLQRLFASDEPALKVIRLFGAKPDKNFVDGQAAIPSSWKTP